MSESESETEEELNLRDTVLTLENNSVKQSERDRDMNRQMISIVHTFAKNDETTLNSHDNIQRLESKLDDISNTHDSRKKTDSESEGIELDPEENENVNIFKILEWLRNSSLERVGRFVRRISHEPRV
jgi:hypothetical protein